MSKTAIISPEQAAIRQYDRRRRLDSNQVIVVAFMGILAAILITFTVYAIFQDSRYALGLDGVFALCLCLYAVSFFATRRENLTVAAISTIVATDVTIVVAALLWITLLSKPLGGGEALNPVSFAQFTSLGIPIILAGVLSDRWLVVVTTVLMNAASLICIHLIGFSSTQGLFTVLALGQQWALMAITLTIAQLYQRTLNELGRAYIQAQQLDGLKDQFITNVNHELRTPVMTIQGYIELLRLRHTHLSPEQLTTSLEQASQTGYTLLGLLNSILDVRNISEEMPPFTPEIVPFKTALDQALVLIDPREGNFSQRELLVQFDQQLSIAGEPVRIQQILTNLLTNAGKYSPAGTPIEIRALPVMEAPPKVKGRRGGRQSVQRAMVEITVRDFGHGISPEQIPLLFNRFVRLPRDLASSISGNGLGLYLCRILAESMEGRIWVESAGVEGEGSTFHLRLPASTPAITADVDDTLPRVRALSRPTSTTTSGRLIADNPPNG